MTRTLRTLSAAIIVAVSFGAGCQPSAPVVQTPAVQPSQPQAPSGPSRAVFTDLTPSQATEKMHFVPGSSFQVLGSDTSVMRQIVIERFAPKQTADISWQLKKGTTNPEPIKLVGIDLMSSHSIELPAYWPVSTTPMSAFGTSASWISSDVFENLSRTHESNLTTGILDPVLMKSAAKDPVVQSALSSLQADVHAIEGRTDVALVKSDAEVIPWKMKVNGGDVTVEAIKVHTWYGDMSVLNNPQNPLVLSFSFGLPSSAANAASITKTLKPLLDYHVANVDGVEE